MSFDLFEDPEDKTSGCGIKYVRFFALLQLF